MKDAGPTAAALLIECRANGAEGLKVSRIFWDAMQRCRAPAVVANTMLIGLLVQSNPALQDS
jgi:hypothetical protein